MRLAILALACVLAVGTSPARSEETIYSVRNVPAEAVATDGVVARDRAFADARRTAWSRLATEFDALPPATDAEIEDMVESLVIEWERIGPTRYRGRLTVNFNPARVRAFLRLAGPAAPPGAAAVPPGFVTAPPGFVAAPPGFVAAPPGFVR